MRDPLDPDESEKPWCDEEIKLSVRHRPVATKIPRVGSTVLYRDDHHRDVVEATVVMIHPLADDDPHRLMCPHDPWPILRLRTIHGLVDCREARVRGAAGWLPISWIEA